MQSTKDGPPFSSTTGRRRSGFQGAQSNRPGLFLRASTPFMRHVLGALRRALNPLAEGTCFSQALSNDLIFSYYAEGRMASCMRGHKIRYFPLAEGTCFSQVAGLKTFDRPLWGDRASCLYEQDQSHVGMSALAFSRSRALSRVATILVRNPLSTRLCLSRIAGV